MARGHILRTGITRPAPPVTATLVSRGGMQSVKAASRWLPTPASQQHAAALRQEAARLAKELAGLGAELVVLFGSVVRDAVGETSDLDLLVVLATRRRFVARGVWLAEVLQPTVPVDFLVYTPAEFARQRHWPFIRTVLADGQVLYARGSIPAHCYVANDSARALRLAGTVIEVVVSRLQPTE